MSTATRTELRKLRSTTSLWAIPVGGVALSAAATVVLMGWIDAAELPTRLSDHGSLRFGPSNLGLLLLLFGVRLFADEHHHGTLATTFLAEPDRRRVLAAKAGVAAAVALLVAAAIDVAVLVTTAVTVDQRDLPMAVDPAATLALVGRAGAAMALVAVLGVSVAAAVRNRAVALVACLAWLALGEDIAGGLLRIPQLLPGSLVEGLVTNGGGPDRLAALPAAAGLAAYVLAATAAAVVSLRRDLD